MSILKSIFVKKESKKEWSKRINSTLKTHYTGKIWLTGK